MNPALHWKQVKLPQVNILPVLPSLALVEPMQKASQATGFSKTKVCTACWTAVRAAAQIPLSAAHIPLCSSCAVSGNTMGCLRPPRHSNTRPTLPLHCPPQTDRNTMQQQMCLCTATLQGTSRRQQLSLPLHCPALPKPSMQHHTRPSKAPASTNIAQSLQQPELCRLRSAVMLCSAAHLPPDRTTSQMILPMPHFNFNSWPV